MSTAHDPPLRLPLRRDRPFHLSVWVTLGPSQPAEHQLVRAVTTWLERYTQAPFRDSLRAFVEGGNLRFEVVAAGSHNAPPLVSLREAGLGGEEERRLKAATHEIHIRCQDFPGNGPALALPAVLAASRALTQAHTGVSMERETPRVPPVFLDREMVTPTLRFRDLATIVTRYRDGSQLLRTYGLSLVGLPELRLEGVPPGLGTSAEAALEAVAQIILSRQRKAWTTTADLEFKVASELQIRLDHPALLKVGFAPPVFPNAQRAAVVRLEWVRPVSSVEPGHVGSTHLSGEAEAPCWRLVAPHGFHPGGTPPRAAQGSPSAGPGSSSTPGGSREDHSRWVESLTHQLLGFRETAPKVVVDVEAGREQARRELAELKGRYQKGLPRGTQLYVRKAFATKDGQGELMWVHVSDWGRDGLRGQLSNVPKKRLDLRIGQKLLVTEDDVFDWMVRTHDGSELGAFTLAPDERWKVR